MGLELDQAGLGTRSLVEVVITVCQTIRARCEEAVWESLERGALSRGAYVSRSVLGMCP